MFTQRQMDYMIYAPFVLGTVYCYGEYLVARYYPARNPISLDTTYQSDNELCSKTCSNIKAQMCQEWTTLPDSSVCSSVCDTYLEADIHNGNWQSIFKCVADASSSQGIQSCGVTCTSPTEL